MAPGLDVLVRRIAPVEKPTDPDALILESWAQGYMVGSLIIMAAVTIANMRRGVLLHKLILLELILGTFHGTFIFAHPPEYGWYLSSTAIFLNMSWSLHNVIAWMKTKPFLSRRWSLFYIGTVILAQPYWVVEIYANFTYFNNVNRVFLTTRPYEALFRDPWWIFTTVNLFYNISTRYSLSLPAIVRASPRFAVLLAAMTLSIAFIIVDICAVTGALASALPDGLNPFWKLAFVFKCLTDSIILDDFKTALDKLCRFRMARDPALARDLDLEIGPNDDFCARGTNDMMVNAWARPRRGASMLEDPLGDDAEDRSRGMAGDVVVVECPKTKPSVLMRPATKDSVEMSFAEFLENSASSDGK